MKRVLLVSAILFSLTGAAQHYIQGSIQQGSAPNSVNIMFLPNYTKGPTEVVNYLSLAIAIPTASATGVNPALSMTGPFTGMNMVPAIPFSYTEGSLTIYTWVYSSVPSSMSWTNGVAFVGATITFEGGTGASNVRLVDFTNKGGGASTNSLFIVVTTNFPFDVVNYSNMFYPINGANGSTTGTDSQLDQYVQTSLPVFLSSVCPVPGIPGISGIDTTKATITWNAVPGVGTYEYELSTNATPTSPISTTSLSISPTELMPGTTYYFNIRSVCSPGNYSGWTAVSFATICPATTAINVIGITPTGAKIKWQAVQASALGYQYAITNSATNPSPAGATGTLADSVILTGLNEGTTYYAHVRVNCSPGVFSQWFNVPFTTTYPPCFAPVAIIVANKGDSANFKWRSVTNSIGYEYAVSTSQIPPVSGIATTDTTGKISGLQSNTKYYIYVRTKCGPNRYSPWISQAFTSSCFRPLPFITGYSILAGTAELGWHKIKLAMQYEYAILTHAAPPVGTMNFTTDTMVHAAHLTPGNKYYLYVRTYCAPAVVSEWSKLEFNTSGLNVNFNPSSRILNILVYGIESQNEELAVFDGVGKLIKKVRLTGNTIAINMGGLAAGFYIIRYGKHGKYVSKIILPN